MTGFRRSASIAGPRIRSSKRTVLYIGHSRGCACTMSTKSFPAAMTGRIGLNTSGALLPSASAFSPAELSLCRLRHGHAHHLRKVNVWLSQQFSWLHRVAHIRKQQFARLLELGVLLARIAESVGIVFRIALLQDRDVIDHFAIGPRSDQARRSPKDHFVGKDL